ncbi:hypothetical protein IHE45_01G021700 [Dioscorea alata]|uniref:Uncharacterized protein n=1 Tax=Dioscorea alata TaxID=55571 RepID=A0ACB7WTP2_DIOAL|nr:hypothetical protein IHE45_01G021700 [Dioscorea alata]
MKIQSFILLTISSLLIFLVLGQVFSLSCGRETTYNNAEQRSMEMISAPSVRYFSRTISPSQHDENGDVSPSFAMYDRSVPQGPNPLHN